MALRMEEVSAGEEAAGQLEAPIAQLLQETTNSQLPHTLLLVLPPWTALHALRSDSVLCSCRDCAEHSLPSTSVAFHGLRICCLRCRCHVERLSDMQVAKVRADLSHVLLTSEPSAPA